MAEQEPPALHFQEEATCKVKTIHPMPQPDQEPTQIVQEAKTTPLQELILLARTAPETTTIVLQDHIPLVPTILVAVAEDHPVAAEEEVVCKTIHPLS